MTRRRNRRVRPRVGPAIPAILFAGLTACVGVVGSGVVGPPPEPGRAVTTWVVERTQPRRHALNLRNDSDAVIRITAVTLRRCENVRESCDRYSVDVVLQPGEHARLLIIHPRNAAEAVFFDWGYDATFLDG